MFTNGACTISQIKPKLQLNVSAQNHFSKIIELSSKRRKIKQTCTITPSFRTSARVHRTQPPVQNITKPTVAAVRKLDGGRRAPQVNAVLASSETPSVAPLVQNTGRHEIRVGKSREGGLICVQLEIVSDEKTTNYRSFPLNVPPS